MATYLTRLIDVRVGDRRFSLKALQDLQQFHDPAGDAERAGISSALWALFGQVWPSGCVLARHMQCFELAGQRILEIGCGLGLSSLVLHQRGADITASDHHPLAQRFIVENAARNGLDALPYRDLPWGVPDHRLGRFDVIIGSDILYERGHAVEVAALIERHAKPAMQVIISDPGRGNSPAFSRSMAAHGYRLDEQRLRFQESDVPPFRGRLLDYRRG